VNLFDRLVDQALQGQTGLGSLRVVVEKELLHHDILREMSAAGLLNGLTFIGGTCLRACYGSNRLSEDLDFTAGASFRREALSDLGRCVQQGIDTRYGLTVEVSDPVRETGNVNTWKLKVITRPERKDLPSQKINIDICSLPSYDRRPMLLRNRYAVEMGTSGLILQAQSREEILADKIVAFVLRPNRIKYRDLWDIAWLKQQNIRLPLAFIPKKVADHRHDLDEFIETLSERVEQICTSPTLHEEFVSEMNRFLPPDIIAETVNKSDFWIYLTELIRTESDAVQHSIKHPSAGGAMFRM
jgi:predicted nucleotidyltransferase component of viral defense system